MALREIDNVAQLAGTQGCYEDDDGCEGHGGSPEDPLALSHVIDVRCVHAQVTRNERQWEEDDCHNGEGVDRIVVTIFVRLDHANVPTLQLVRTAVDLFEVGNATLDVRHALLDHRQILSRRVTVWEDSVGRCLPAKNSPLESGDNV